MPPVSRSWDQTWAAVADAIAARSHCSARQVGAVVVSEDNASHWVGYNGPPASLVESVKAALGLPDAKGCGFYCPQGQVASGRPLVRGGQLERDESWSGCPSVHAEVNALMKSDPQRRSGGTAYTTAAPCWKCALAIANSGVRRLVSREWETDRIALRHDVRNMYEYLGMEIEPWPMTGSPAST